MSYYTKIQRFYTSEIQYVNMAIIMININTQSAYTLTNLAQHRAFTTITRLEHTPCGSLHETERHTDHMSGGVPTNMP